MADRSASVLAMATIAKRSRRRKGGRVSTWLEGRIGSDSTGRNVFTGKARREVEQKIQQRLTNGVSQAPSMGDAPVDQWVQQRDRVDERGTIQAVSATAHRVLGWATSIQRSDGVSWSDERARRSSPE